MASSPEQNITYDFDTSLVECIASSDIESADEENTLKLKFTCEFCKIKKFTSIHRLLLHMNKNHGFQIKNFENRCNVCLKIFANKTYLPKHYRKQHKIPAACYCCPFCQDKMIKRTEMRYIYVK